MSRMGEIEVTYNARKKRRQIQTYLSREGETPGLTSVLRWTLALLALRKDWKILQFPPTTLDAPVAARETIPMSACTLVVSCAYWWRRWTIRWVSDIVSSWRKRAGSNSRLHVWLPQPSPLSIARSP